MAAIQGTPQPDQLLGTDNNDLIRGGRGEDFISGGLGDDTLYGGWGNDVINDYYGRSEIYGGRGSDQISFISGHAWGGWGNDTIETYGGGWAIGGTGNDTLIGSGALWGDQGPDVPIDQWSAGDDTFLMYADPDSAMATGGLGSDRFHVFLNMERADIGIIADFTPGVDKLKVYGQPPDGESPFDIFLDTNRDGVMDENDGGQVWVDTAANTITLGVGLSRLEVHGTTQIAASDWDPDWLI